MKPDDLKLCIEALKALRQEMHEETDTGVICKLEGVIFQLEVCLEAGGQCVTVPAETRYNTLEILGDVLRVVTNLSEFVRLWLDMQ